MLNADIFGEVCLATSQTSLATSQANEAHQMYHQTRSPVKCIAKQTSSNVSPPKTCHFPEAKILGVQLRFGSQCICLYAKFLGVAMKENALLKHGRPECCFGLVELGICRRTALPFCGLSPVDRTDNPTQPRKMLTVRSFTVKCVENWGNSTMLPKDAEIRNICSPEEQASLKALFIVRRSLIPSDNK
ncbi:hypothetical protein Y032_0001g12 [Ancylostoma ceylanicum]|uniref:Uncharacterized protein n=1 Tax=Ancylostoma ceylanicum TaxID=53326 RepID=A0A016W3G6_9BILA|nr:hypothetical protein Y032_0001g12 [Ancylostoma ceylanicum]